MSGIRSAPRPPSFFPSFSKEVWFQCQAFARNVLAVLWDLKGLRSIQIYFLPSKLTLAALPTFRPAGGNRRGIGAAFGFSRDSSLALMLNFRKK
jgi:hypothetical protein